MRISEAYQQEMIAHAQETYPNECCGFLSGDGDQVLQVHRMTNLEASPSLYSMDLEELRSTYQRIDEQGQEILVLYHSHPRSQAYPSAGDVELAPFPEARYLIVSLLDREVPVIKAFRILAGEIVEEEIYG